MCLIGRMVEGKGRMTDDGGRMTEDIGRMMDDGWQNTDGGRRREKRNWGWGMQNGAKNKAEGWKLKACRMGANLIENMRYGQRHGADADGRKRKAEYEMKRKA